MIVSAILLLMAMQPDPTVPGVRPIGSPGEWIGVDDYPPEALRSRTEGIVAFRLSVGADGLPTGCVITVSSGSPVLDAATCSLVTTRARFTAVPGGGSYASRVRWHIPAARETMLAP